MFIIHVLALWFADSPPPPLPLLAGWPDYTTTTQHYVPSNESPRRAGRRVRTRTRAPRPTRLIGARKSPSAPTRPVGGAAGAGLSCGGARWAQWVRARSCSYRAHSGRHSRASPTRTMARAASPRSQSNRYEISLAAHLGAQHRCKLGDSHQADQTFLGARSAGSLVLRFYSRTPRQAAPSSQPASPPANSSSHSARGCLSRLVRRRLTWRRRRLGSARFG